MTDPHAATDHPASRPSAAVPAQVTIATRKSPLALWQAEFVAAALKAAHPGLEVSLLTMQTSGDRFLDASLAEKGGKGLFVKELETALLDGRADLAVHSMKDVPVELPQGLAITAILDRHDPRDAFVSNRFGRFEALPPGAVVATSSLRRSAQLRALRPDLEIVPLRGNVNTRLRKLDDGEFDAAVLAVSGLTRLGFSDRIASAFEPTQMLPAIAQGALGIESRVDDAPISALVSCLDHPATHDAVRAERTLNAALGGGCHLPVAAFAAYTDEAKSQIEVNALVADTTGERILRDRLQGSRTEAVALGARLADNLLAAGAAELLEAVRQNAS